MSGIATTDQAVEGSAPSARDAGEGKPARDQFLSEATRRLSSRRILRLWPDSE